MRVTACVLGFIAIAALSAANSARAQTPDRTPPPTVTLTSEQWACLGTRVNNLQRASSDIVRVPLSSCGQGDVTRTTGAGNPTVRQTNRTPLSDPRLTRSPLYLTKTHLACIQRQLPQLSAQSSEPVQVDLARCSIT